MFLIGRKIMKKLLGIFLILFMAICIVSCDLIPDKPIGDGSTDDGIGDGSNTDGDNKPDNPGDNTGDNGSGDNKPDNPGDNTGDIGSGDNDGGSTDPIPTPTPDPDMGAVYLFNRAGWEQVAVYYWGSRGEIEGGWPGRSITADSVGLYKAVVPDDYSFLIFNNTSL